MPPPTLTVVDGADRTPNLLAPVVPDRIVVCQSPAMVRLYEQIERIARTPVTVVIEGETGVGKELVARTLHGQSPRREKPFVPVNCGAIPETIQESLLFGHERGAFTDANQRKEGYFRQADGGTILLDEVVELNARAQTSLLRVMQDYKVRSIGGREEVQVDVRVIAATNKSLEQAVKDGSFREDLYYRLNVITLTVPPLRERLEDIPLLARYFVDHYATKYGTGAKELSGGAMIQLLAYDWPGNIRQLENVIQAAVALDDDGTIGKDDIDLPTHRQGSVLRRALQEQERAGFQRRILNTVEV